MYFQIQPYTQENEYKKFMETVKTPIIQQSWDWLLSISNFDKKATLFNLAAYEGDKIVACFPSFLFKGIYGNMIQSLPHSSYGGIIISDSCNFNDIENIYNTFFKIIDKIAKENDCVSITISTPPFVNKTLYDNWKANYTIPNFYQYIPLHQITFDISTEKFDRSIKRNIKKDDGNIEIYDATSIEDISEWYKIYQKRMQEKQSYVMSFDLFTSVLSNMNPNHFKFRLVKRDNKIIGGGLFIFNDYIMDDYICVLDSDFNDTGINQKLIYDILKWAKSRNIKYFNWQSTPSKKSSVYEFKKRWASIEDNHYYITKIYKDINYLKSVNLIDLRNAYLGYFFIPFSALKGDSYAK